LIALALLITTPGYRLFTIPSISGKLFISKRIKRVIEGKLANYLIVTRNNSENELSPLGNGKGRL